MYNKACCLGGLGRALYVGTLERPADHAAPCGLKRLLVFIATTDHAAPSGLTRLMIWLWPSSFVAIMAVRRYTRMGFWGCVLFLLFFGRFGGTSLRVPCVFHPTSTGVPGPLAHPVGVDGPGQGHLLGMRPSPLKPWGGVGLPVIFTSQQCSAGRQALGGRGVVPLARGLSRRRATAFGLRLVSLHTFACF